MAGDVDDEWPDIPPRRVARAAVVAIPLFAPIYSVLFDVSIERALASSIVFVPVMFVIHHVVLTRSRGGDT